MKQRYSLSTKNDYVIIDRLLNNDKVEIEMVRQIWYLGFTFSSSSKFVKTTIQALKKSTFEIHSVKNFLIQGKSAK